MPRDAGSWCKGPVRFSQTDEGQPDSICIHLEKDDGIALQDHSPSLFDERMRIQKAGGIIVDGRVSGILEGLLFQ